MDTEHCKPCVRGCSFKAGQSGKSGRERERVCVCVCLSVSVCVSATASVSLSLFLPFSFSLSLFLSFSLSLFLSFSLSLFLSVCEHTPPTQCLSLGLCRSPPTHLEVQQQLFREGDKAQSFVGSREWIGTLEAGRVLQCRHQVLFGWLCTVVSLWASWRVPHSCFLLLACSAISESSSCHLGEWPGPSALSKRFKSTFAPLDRPSCAVWRFPKASMCICLCVSVCLSVCVLLRCFLIVLCSAFCVCVCVCLCLSVCVCVCVCLSVCVCVCVTGGTCDNMSRAILAVSFDEQGEEQEAEEGTEDAATEVIKRTSLLIMVCLTIANACEFAI